MPYQTNPEFIAYETLDAADMGILTDNLDYLNTKINEQIQLFAWKPRAFYGASPGSFETVNNKINIPTMDFPDSVIAVVQILHELPADYDGGTVTAHFIWTCENSTTNSVVWQLRARAFSDGDAFDQELGSLVTVTDANNNNKYCNISGESSALTIAGTPAAGKLVVWEVYRDPAHASDNLGQTARLIGVIIKYSRA